MKPEIHTFRHPNWLTNTYLLSRGPDAILIDAGTELSVFPPDEVQKIRAIFLTHNHSDHIDALEKIRTSLSVPVYSHALEVPKVRGATLLHDEQDVDVAGFSIRALHTPGHTRGHLSFLIKDVGVFTGDILFREAVGGTANYGAGGVDALRSSVLQKILELPPDTVIYPGHQESTTVAHELSHNTIVRAWLGEEELLSKPCKVGAKAGTILAEGPDYDGDTKVWVRFSDDSEIVIAGSDVEY